MQTAVRRSPENRPAAEKDEIAKLAYYFYVRRGRIDGHAEEDWFRAEQYFRNLRGCYSSSVRNAA